MSKWIKKGDKVLVIAGNDKGKVGEVMKKGNDRVVVQGVNLRKKHIKKTGQTQASQIVEMEMPIHISNVAFVDANDKKIKPKVKMTEQGKKLVYLYGDKERILREIK
ncbi:MAG: 50S ribosomal protein L24 [Parachlamydiales bacterium]|nr:50S ribosomal protein L24 [Parachlamydiales bacterium]